MYSLYHVLLSQHGDEFAPVRCNEQTVMRLSGYFEDVVIENKLSALVVECSCIEADQSRSLDKIGKLASVANQLYWFSSVPPWGDGMGEPPVNLTVLEEPDQNEIETGPFVVVMAAKFAGLLASCRVDSEDAVASTTYEMIWTFDANIVFTAIEYLMARINARSPADIRKFETVLNACTPRSSSLRTAQTFTNKLAMLMQRQNDLETATNRISSAISSTLDLDQIMQSAVHEVGRALKANRAAIVLWTESTGQPETMEVYNGGEESRVPPVGTSALSLPPGPLRLQITYRQTVIGELVVEDDTPGRIWEPEEMLMVNTVCDQLAVAVDHARLFKQIQTQAITDALTGLYNHRYLQERLERETKLADRNGQPVSLILLDLDHLKRINDSHGHRSGDAALRYVATTMKNTVRDVDVCARYGGEEFVIILPQCPGDDAIDVAERLREAIASSPVPGIGQVTASIGVASYPMAARNKEELVEMADRAMYLAKASGRNRVRTLMHRSYPGMKPPGSHTLESQILE
jgi:diguanylate cyclase (GGDEF)-like protein